MDLSEHLSCDSQIEIERQLLAALCQATVNATTRAAIFQHLKTHNFAIPDHQVVYRALAGLPVMNAADLHAALNVAVTRLGFPDLELQEFFRAPAPSNSEIASLLAGLSRKSE